MVCAAYAIQPEHSSSHTIFHGAHYHCWLVQNAERLREVYVDARYVMMRCAFRARATSWHSVSGRVKVLERFERDLACTPQSDLWLPGLCSLSYFDTFGVKARWLELSEVMYAKLELAITVGDFWDFSMAAWAQVLADCLFMLGRYAHFRLEPFWRSSSHRVYSPIAWIYIDARFKIRHQRNSKNVAAYGMSHDV